MILPHPWDYCYEWDGPYGTRKFSSASHNGARPARSVPIFTADQMRAYAAAAVLAERERAERLRAKLQEIGDFAASCATGPGLREALAMIERMVAEPKEQQP